ncbi:MAG: hypothetical protein JST30_16545 [Armatimonadetes bacterium]|nr:hypothetical protein [Armatimonadota bacterium]
MEARTVQRQTVRLSTIVLVTVALFDLVSTLMWLNMGHGEGNPIFAYLASVGTGPFVLGKLLFLVVPLLAIEYARTKRPVTAEVGTWVAAVAYAGLWGSHVIRLAA